MNTTLNIAIFCIDDDPGQRFLLDALFKQNGIHNYTIFSDPEKLLESLHAGVQICVLDFNLKNAVHDGLTLMKEILLQNSYCKCIIMSGYEDASMIKSFLNCGAFRYVTKGEDDFDKHLIEYIEEAIRVVVETHTFYTTVLGRITETKNLLTSYKEDGQANY